MKFKLTVVCCERLMTLITDSDKSAGTCIISLLIFVFLLNHIHQLYLMKGLVYPKNMYN